MASNTRPPRYFKTSLAVSLGLVIAMAACETPEPLAIDDSPATEVGLGQGGTFKVADGATSYLVDLTDAAIGELEFGISTDPAELLRFVEQALQTGEVDITEPGTKLLLHKVLEKVEHSVSFGELRSVPSAAFPGRLVELKEIERKEELQAHFEAQENR